MTLCEEFLYYAHEWRPIPKPRKEVIAMADQAFCVKCRETHAMANPKRVTLSNGRPAIKGTCPTCKSGMVRLVKA